MDDTDIIHQLNAVTRHYQNELRESQHIVEDDDDQLFPFSMDHPSPGTAKAAAIPALSMSLISNQTSFDDANGMMDSRRSHCSTCSTQRSSASESTNPPVIELASATPDVSVPIQKTTPQPIASQNETASTSLSHQNAPSILLESHYLDEAASMMIGSTATLFPQHHTPSSEVAIRAESSSQDGSGWKDFSILLQQADDTVRVVTPSRPVPAAALPMVIEEGMEHSDMARTPDPGEDSVSSSVVIVESLDPPSNVGMNGLRIGNHRLSPTSSQSQQLFHANNSNERRLAELVGASVAVVGGNTFVVSIDLSVNPSMEGMISFHGNSESRHGVNQHLVEQQSSMKEAILDVLGNPDLLRLWCDAIPSSTSLIIVRSSEGARNAIDRSRPADTNREYEGEWIEAICRPGFVVPAKSSSSRIRNCSALGRYLMDWTSSLSSLMGCPRASGTVTMFVERRAGQVSLTFNPFPGNLQVIHRIKVTPLPNGKIRVEDTVRLLQEDDGHIPLSIFSCCCNLWDGIQQCFLPTMDDYMDQTLSSMARLRFLIENGEDAARGIECSTVNDPLWSDRFGMENANETLLMSARMEGSNMNTNDLRNPLLVRLIA